MVVGLASSMLVVRPSMLWEVARLSGAFAVLAVAAIVTVMLLVVWRLGFIASPRFGADNRHQGSDNTSQNTFLGA